MPYPEAVAEAPVGVTGPPVAYTVTVYVRDSATNLPVAGASVSLNAFSGSTDERGYVTFSNVPAGTYTLKVSKSGYLSYSKTVEITADTTLEVPLEPIPPGTSSVTVTVKLFGLIPVAGVSVTLDGYTGTTDSHGKASFLVEMDKEYSGEATHRFLETARFKFKADKPELEVTVSVIPKLWIMALVGGSTILLIYALTRPPKPIVVTV